MDKDDILNAIKQLFESIMDIDPLSIDMSSFVIRDLEVESIDLLELAVDISSEFDIEVEDDLIFLSHLRASLADVDGDHQEEALLKLYPHIQRERAQVMLSELSNGPVLQVQDLVSYVVCALK